MNPLIQKVINEKLLLDGEEFEKLAQAIRDIPDDVTFYEAVRPFVMPYADVEFVNHYRSRLTLFGSAAGQGRGVIADRALSIMLRLIKQTDELLTKIPDDETAEGIMGRVNQLLMMIRPYRVQFKQTHLIEKLWSTGKLDKVQMAGIRAMVDEYNKTVGRPYP
jgi:hypothetical protein